MPILTEQEIDILLKLLLKLYQQTKSQDIKRVAKSLFSLLTQNRFSTDNDLPIIK